MSSFYSDAQSITRDNLIHFVLSTLPVSYDTVFSGLMDLPHLMDNLRVDHRRMDNAARYPQLHSPSRKEGIYFWQE